MPSRFNWRHQYDNARDLVEQLKTDIVNNDPSMTQQHFKEDADLNTIMRRFGVTDGAIPPAALDARFFGDFSNVPDFREALDQTRQAVERFNLLPASIRNRFQNDPTLLFAWVSDPANTEEAIKIGLLKKIDPPPKPTFTPPAPVAPPAPAA